MIDWVRSLSTLDFAIFYAAVVLVLALVKHVLLVPREPRETDPPAEPDPYDVASLRSGIRGFTRIALLELRIAREPLSETAVLVRAWDEGGATLEQLRSAYALHERGLRRRGLLYPKSEKGTLAARDVVEWGLAALVLVSGLLKIYLIWKEDPPGSLPMFLLWFFTVGWIGHSMSTNVTRAGRAYIASVPKEPEDRLMRFALKDRAWEKERTNPIDEYTLRAWVDRFVAGDADPDADGDGDSDGDFDGGE